MSTATRRYQSKDGLDVPQIMIDLSSSWHEMYPKADQYLNISDYQNHIAAIVNASKLEREKKGFDSPDMLGMHAFKTPNVTENVFNVLSKSPASKSRQSLKKK